MKDKYDIQALGVSQARTAEEYALSLPGGYADSPFPDDFVTTVLRHGAGGKWFGLLMLLPASKFFAEKEGKLWVFNLKIDPEDGYVYKEMFEDILPAYHMNKHLWISVLLTGTVPDEVLSRLILKSYMLTKKKERHQKEEREV